LKGTQSASSHVFGSQDERKKLYELARSGIEVERTPRKVKIHFINILSIRGNRVVFDVDVPKALI